MQDLGNALYIKTKAMVIGRTSEILSQSMYKYRGFSEINEKRKSHLKKSTKHVKRHIQYIPLKMAFHVYFFTQKSLNRVFYCLPKHSEFHA